MKSGGFYNKASELYEKGYYVVDIPIGGKMPVRKEWPKLRMNEADISAINKQKYDPGVGIITGQLNGEYSIIAIDIDIRDKGYVDKIIEHCQVSVGISPVRVGNPPKSLLVYKYKGERKKQVSGADAEHNRIEVLGTGQQFVAYAIHPDKQIPYEWSSEIPSFNQLIEINDEQIDGIIEKWYEIQPEARSEKKVRIDADGNEQYVGKSIPEMVMDILAGNNLHDSILGLSQQWSYDGIPEDIIIRDIKAYMRKSSARGEARWQDRYNDIERVVSGAREKEDLVDISDINVEDESSEGMYIPWPPGLLGDLCDDAYSMAPYQYKEVAVVSSIGLIAGIAGRKFNISQSGLNVYMTLIMKTGMGKDFIRKWINRTLMSLNPISGNASSFIGASRYTGPRALAKSLLNARSQISVFTEAGLLLSSQAGDSSGLCRYILSLYSTSGENDHTGTESYSKDEDSLPIMRAAALTYINEATPETLLSAFRDRNALDSGELPRNSIFRVSTVKPYFNDTFSENEIRAECMEKLQHLFKKCSAFQAENDPKAHKMVPIDDEVKQDMKMFSRKMDDIYNNDYDPNRKLMASRAHMKALRFAGIATVFNHNDIYVRKEEWSWAKQMVEYELSTVEKFFAGGGFGNVVDDLAKRVVAPIIIKILRNEYKSAKQQISVTDSKNGIFPKSALVLALKNNRELNEYNDDAKSRSKPVSGLDKVLGYMVDTGYLNKLDWNNGYTTNSGRDDRRQFRNTGRFKITEMFKTLFFT